MSEGPKTTPGALLACALVVWALLGCGPEGGTPGDAPGTTARTAPEAPAAESAGVAEAAAAGVDENSICEHLARLTAAYPVRLAGRGVGIPDGGSEGGRRSAAEYMAADLKRVG